MEGLEGRVGEGKAELHLFFPCQHMPFYRTLRAAHDALQGRCPPHLSPHLPLPYDPTPTHLQSYDTRTWWFPEILGMVRCKGAALLPLPPHAPTPPPPPLPCLQSYDLWFPKILGMVR